MTLSFVLAVISQLYLASFETNKESYCVWANRGLEQVYICIRMELLQIVLSNCLSAIFKWPRMERSS